MFHIITTSRTTRALHRFQSHINFLFPLTLSAALGWLLLFCAAPELFM